MSPGDRKNKDTLENSGTLFHAASASSIDLKRGFNNSSKAARLVEPGITQAAILKTLTKLLINPVFRSLGFLAGLLVGSGGKKS